jgi:hypothetical protein
MTLIGRGDASVVDAGAIDNLFEREQRQWNAFWRMRLDQFGHSLTSF